MLLHSPFKVFQTYRHADCGSAFLLTTLDTPTNLLNKREVDLVVFVILCDASRCSAAE